MVSERNPDGTEKTLMQHQAERELDKITAKAADAIEKQTLKAGRKAWNWLEKTKEFGAAAKKVAKRYGAAARKGARLAGPAGQVLNAWETGTTIGSVIGEQIAVPMIDRYFDSRSEQQQEQLSREIAHLRSRGLQRRQHKQDLADILAVGLAMRKLQEDKRRAKAPADP